MKKEKIQIDLDLTTTKVIFLFVVGCMEIILCVGNAYWAICYGNSMSQSALCAVIVMALFAADNLWKVLAMLLSGAIRSRSPFVATVGWKLLTVTAALSAAYLNISGYVFPVGGDSTAMILSAAFYTLAVVALPLAVYVSYIDRLEQKISQQTIEEMSYENCNDCVNP